MGIGLVCWISTKRVRVERPRRFLMLRQQRQQHICLLFRHMGNLTSVYLWRRYCHFGSSSFFPLVAERAVENRIKACHHARTTSSLHSHGSLVRFACGMVSRSRMLKPGRLRLCQWVVFSNLSGEQNKFNHTTFSTHECFNTSTSRNIDAVYVPFLGCAADQPKSPELRTFIFIFLDCVTWLFVGWPFRERSGAKFQSFSCALITGLRLHSLTRTWSF